MFKNLGALTEEQKTIQRAPKGTSKKEVELKKGLNYEGKPSSILAELDALPLLDDLPW